MVAQLGKGCETQSHRIVWELVLFIWFFFFLFLFSLFSFPRFPPPSPHSQEDTDFPVSSAQSILERLVKPPDV